MSEVSSWRGREGIERGVRGRLRGRVEQGSCHCQRNFRHLAVMCCECAALAQTFELPQLPLHSPSSICLFPSLCAIPSHLCRFKSRNEASAVPSTQTQAQSQCLAFIWAFSLSFPRRLLPAVKNFIISQIII